MTKQNDSDRKYVLEHTQEWLGEFLKLPGIPLRTNDFSVSAKQIREIVRKYSLAMCDDYGRRPRRWTGVLTKKLARKYYAQAGTKEWRMIFLTLCAYFAYLEGNGHIGNAAALQNALIDFDATDKDNVAGDLAAGIRDSWKRASGANYADLSSGSSFHPDDVLNTLADFYGLQEEKKRDNSKFMRAHFSEFVLMAEGATGMDLILCNAIADGYGQADMNYIAAWFGKIVLPDIDLAKMLGGQQPPQDKQKMAALTKQLAASFVADGTPLPTDLRMQFAAQIDGDSLANPGGEQRFMNRHAAILQQFFNVRPRQERPPKHAKPAKVISLADARRRLQQEKNSSK